ncbi:MAG: hypothetical protein JRH10_06065 [Deltaproteobacteria bacterium]|nr:hypothetical protein [Deltaproteobacteria bacterium]MBW2448527.1 hypothetical protein [Deltaproteobacteria bacterium]
MRIEQIEQVAANGKRRVSGRVRFADGQSSGLWFLFPDAGPLTTPADALFAALLPGALGVREDLHIDGAVSADLLAVGRDRILPTLARFHPGYDAIEVTATEPLESSAPAGGVAALFSGGLDSSYTLARHRDRLTHLVFAHGFDVGLKRTAVLQRVGADLAVTARASGLQLIEVSSRIRPTIYRELQTRIRAKSPVRVRFLLGWGVGCLLTSYGQILSRSIGRLLVAGSWDDRYEGATASHPDIEPRWSTPALQIELDGIGPTRIDKARFLADQEPDLLRRLRVCQSRPVQPTNCGACPKCIRLRMELRVAGIDPALHPFAESLSDFQLRRSFVTIDGYFWPEILRQAETSGDRRAARTAEILMDRRFHLGREISRLRARVRHPGWLHARKGYRGPSAT